MIRNLKIEETGDYFTGKTTPSVRLKGKWLEAAGFPPGMRLEVKVCSPGRLELRVIQPGMNAVDAIPETTASQRRIHARSLKLEIGGTPTTNLHESH